MNAPNPQHPISHEVTYVVNLKHRDPGRIGDSQWRVSEQSEVECFRASLARNWLLVDSGWGLIPVDAAPAQLLGVDVDHRSPAFLAYFEFDGPNAYWHGYPVVNNHDRFKPPTKLLDVWLRERRIRDATHAKLRKGKRCAVA